MTYTPQNFRLGPESTPSIIKKLIFITGGASLLAALFTNFFNVQLGIPGPEEWFSLSWWGMSRYLWWQPVTFLFIHHTGYQGINLGFLSLLLFNMYILWVMGSDVYQRVGKTPFLRFYFITGIVAGLLAFLLMPITRQFGIVSGATPSILGSTT